jgi:hypothetical protein
MALPSRSASRPAGRAHLRRSSHRAAYLPILLAIFGLGASAALFFSAVDPYDLYPWGATPRLERERYEPAALPYLLNVVARADYDTVVIGGSTSQLFQSVDLAQSLAGTSKAFNFSYPGARPRDLALVMKKLAAAPKLKRVLLSFDVSFVFDPKVARSDFPFMLYDDDPWNDLRALGVSGLELSSRLLLGKEYFVAAWDPRQSEEVWREQFEYFQRDAAIRKQRKAITRRRAEVLNPSPMTCADFPTIATVRSLADQLHARGIPLDIVIPPYSYLAYYVWVGQPRESAWMANAPLNTLLAMRKCLLESVADLGDVRVFAFDLQPEIVEDLANYRDPAHLYGRETELAMLRGIDSNRARLTLGEFEAYANELRERVAAYEYRNSRLRE